MTEQTRARLAERGIQAVAETESHVLYARDNLIALLERRHGTIGSTGMLTGDGLAYLIWRDGQAYLKSKHAENAATEQQVEAVRRFSEDLAGAM